MELVSFLLSGSDNYSRTNKMRLKDTDWKSMFFFFFFLKNPSLHRVVVNLEAAEGRDVYLSQTT